MKYILLLPFIILSFNITAQDTNLSSEVYPEFPECENVDFSSQEYCFNVTLINYIKENFQVPEIVQEENYKGQLTIIFEVDEEGEFQLIFVDAAYEELKEEVGEVFQDLPKLKPATYNGRAIHMQFKMPLRLPLKSNLDITSIEEQEEVLIAENDEDLSENELKQEYDRIKSDEFTNPRYKSQINIPLSHEFYSRFDSNINMVGTNMHTASKPFLFEEINKYAGSS